MKKIFFGLALMISVSSFAANPSVNEKVSRSFNETFPNIANAKWYEYESYYEVLFMENNITCRAQYDLNGNIISVRRDYSEKELAPFILAKLKAKYADKKIFGITEMSSSEGTSYNIVLEDEKNWITVKSDDAGHMSVVQKLKKA
jgi:hypothetical protein